MKIFVLDNSVILKPLLQEEGRDKVEKIFRLKEKFHLSILVPDLFRYEFFNILSRAMKISKIFECFYALTSCQFSIIPLEKDLIEEAYKLVLKYPKISFYDASYHALAKAYQAKLITADEKYYQMTQKEGHIQLLADLKI